MTDRSCEPQAGPASLILVVEDEFLVALEIAAILKERGFQILGPVSTVPMALRLLAERRPDAAVLDVKMRNDLVTPVAQALRAMGVPFVVASAYSRAALLNDDLLSEAPKLEKPIVPSELIGVVGRLLARAGRVALQTHDH